MNIADRRVAAVFPAPRATVVVGDRAKAVDSIRKDFFVEVSAGIRVVSISSLLRPRETHAGKAVFLKSASWSP